jgi:hypothetical protein
MATQQLTSPDVDAIFQSDWDLANQRYRAGVDAGYSAEDADNLFLNPVRTKWDILQKVPQQLQSKAATELGNAQLSYIQNVNAGYSPNDANNRVLAPVEQKWEAAGTLREPARPDPLLDEKVGALQEVSAGYNPLSVINGHPRSIFSDPEYVTKFESAAERGQKARASAAAKAQEISDKTSAAVAKKEAAEDDPQTIIKNLNNIVNFAASPEFNVLPPESKQRVADNRATLEKKLATSTAANDLPSTLGGSGTFKTKYRTPEEVRQAYNSKELSKDEATKILQGQFGMQ